MTEKQQFPKDTLLPKRVRTLPSIGPEFRSEKQTNLIGNLIEYARESILLRYPALEQTLATASRLKDYLMSSLASGWHDNATDEQRPTPIKQMAWHGHLMMFAIAHRQDAVYIYDMQLGQWSSCYLSDHRQQNITALQWKPCAGRQLAVGCEYVMMLLYYIILYHAYNVLSGLESVCGRWRLQRQEKKI